MNGVLWLLYAIAGIGLIREREWGRILTLIATSGSLIAMISLLVFVGGTETAYMSTVWPMFGIPAILLFVWALWVRLPRLFKAAEAPPPEGDSRKPRVTDRTLHHIAYASYIILGLISLWTASLEAEPNVIGFLVLIPFGIPLLLALALASGISLYFWRDSHLAALLVLTTVVVIVLNISRLEIWPAILFPYGTICIAKGIIWFKKHRKNHDAAQIKQAAAS